MELRSLIILKEVSSLTSKIRGRTSADPCPAGITHARKKVDHQEEICNDFFPRPSTPIQLSSRPKDKLLTRFLLPSPDNQVSIANHRQDVPNCCIRGLEGLQEGVDVGKVVGIRYVNI